jgi:hypothetical protein
MAARAPYFSPTKKNQLTAYRLSTAGIFINATSGCQMPGNRI